MVFIVKKEKENLMEPRIRTISSKVMIGLSSELTLAKDTTRKMWQRFVPMIKNHVDLDVVDLISIAIYPQELKFEEFNSNTVFEKWAVVEKKNLKTVPIDMRELTIVEGKYAVFIHRGVAASFGKTFGYIFGKWLPNSIYKMDDRPQFEIMKPGYRPDDIHAEEEVWIPIIEEKY